MKKKLIILLLLLVPVYGCKKETTSISSQTSEIVEVDAYDSYYGTWKAAAVKTEGGAVITVAEAESMNEYSISDIYLVIKKGGLLYLYSGRLDKMNSSEWQANEDTTITFNGNKLFINEEWQIEIVLDNESLLFDRYSSSQDISKLPKTVVEESSEAKEESTQVEEVSEVKEEKTGISADFKAAMDSYEEFFDEYVEFMQTYSSSSNPTALMTKYMSYMNKYAEVMEKLDAIDEDELTTEEYNYYMEVMLRINKKLLEAY